MTVVTPEAVAGNEVTATWGAAVEDALNDTGRLPFVYALGMSAAEVSAANVTLAAVSAGLGGATAIPFHITAPFYAQQVQIRNASTANARTAEFGIYREPPGGSATLELITGTTGTFSFTPAAEDDRSANVATPGTFINVGVVWLIIRNTSTTQSFQIRRVTPTQLILSGFCRNVTAASVAALGSTIDITSWGAGTAGQNMARLDGRVTGRTSTI